MTFAPRRIAPGAHAPRPPAPEPEGLVDTLEERWCRWCKERTVVWAHDMGCLYCGHTTTARKRRKDTA